MTSELSVTYRLRRHPSEISRARELARKALTDWGLADHTDLVEVIVSELTTNALLHGAGPITIRLAYTQEGDLWTEVHDHGPTSLVRREASPSDEQGRGLVLLDALTVQHAGTCGEDDDLKAPGKTVFVAVTLASSTMMAD
jgi:anti-sigma regulatory factor (Ser/Thr protein kinase)